jgi:hypothetical protein
MSTVCRHPGVGPHHQSSILTSQQSPNSSKRRACPRGAGWTAGHFSPIGRGGNRLFNAVRDCDDIRCSRLKSDSTVESEKRALAFWTFPQFWLLSDRGICTPPCRHAGRQAGRQASAPLTLSVRLSNESVVQNSAGGVYGRIAVPPWQGQQADR